MILDKAMTFPGNVSSDRTWNVSLDLIICALLCPQTDPETSP
jgi:hypothetical protein